MFLSQLRTHIEQLLSNAAGHFGVAVKDFDTGKAIMINADELFPLASVFKIPVMVELYRQVDEGLVQLDQRLEFTRDDRMPGSGVLRTLQPGFALTIRDYAMLMIIISDNSATDKVMAAIGRHSITPTMRKLGLQGTSVSRTCGQILATLAGYEVEVPTQDQVAEILTALREGRRAATGWAYEESERNNVGTPAEMVQLLELIHTGQAASQNACKEMLGILKSQQLKQRLPLWLPQDVVSAHKTGTLPGVVNDAGIIYVRPDRPCAVAVFSKDGADRHRGSETIAQIGLAIYQALA